MKKWPVGACLALCCNLIAIQLVYAQEWSPAQQGVWKNVEAYWARDAVGDVEGFLSYFHENYIGWDLREPLSTDKARLRKFLEHSYKTEKTILYDIQPVAINVFENIAIAHYHYTAISKDAEGKERDRSGRWTDVLMKQGDRWVVIGDHGGRTSED